MKGQRAAGRKPDFARPTSRPTCKAWNDCGARPRQSGAAAGLGAQRIWLILSSLKLTGVGSCRSDRGVPGVLPASIAFLPEPALVLFGISVYKLPLSKEMKLPQDSRVICAGLDQFCLPAALFVRTTDRFVGWNQSFIEATEISADEMRVVPVSEILRMETPTAEASECETAPAPVHPEKCILKATSDGQPITAKLFEREDGYSLVIVDESTAKQSNEDFIRGLIIGKTEEQDRIRQKFHDDVAPQIMAAAFATETLAERARQGADQDPEELKRIADIITDLVAGIRVALGNRTTTHPNPPTS